MFGRYVFDTEYDPPRHVIEYLQADGQPFTFPSMAGAKGRVQHNLNEPPFTEDNPMNYDSGIVNLGAGLNDRIWTLTVNAPGFEIYLGGSVYSETTTNEIPGLTARVFVHAEPYT